MAAQDINEWIEQPKSLTDQLQQQQRILKDKRFQASKSLTAKYGKWFEEARTLTEQRLQQSAALTNQSLQQKNALTAKFAPLIQKAQLLTTELRQEYREIVFQQVGTPILNQQVETPLNDTVVSNVNGELIRKTDILADNLSAIAAQNQQANRNSNNGVNSAVQMTASSLSQQQAASQAQLYAATLGVQSTSSSSSQASSSSLASSATALSTAAAVTSANQRNIRVTNAQECCCQEIKITISDLAVRYNYNDFSGWDEPGYLSIIGRITMDEPPDWDTVVTLKITNLSAPARNASFTVRLSAGITCQGDVCGYLDPPYTDVFSTSPTYCKQIEPPAPLCEDVSFLTQPFLCESCKIEYVSAYQIVERAREFSSQYNGPGPYPWNQTIFPTVEGPDSTTESPGLLATVEICPYVGEFEFAEKVYLSTTDFYGNPIIEIYDSPYYSPFSCSVIVGILLKTLPTYGYFNLVLKKSDGMMITPEDPNPNDEKPPPPPYWVPGWIFNGTGTDMLNPNQSILWSWNDSEFFTLARPTQTNPFHGDNGGFAGLTQIRASNYSSNNYSTRFNGDWEFDVFEKKWVIRTYDKYFTLDDSDQWQWVGPDNVDGWNWTEGEWVWSEDNENYPRQSSDPPMPIYAPTKSALPASIVLPSEQVGYQFWASLGNASRLGDFENFKIYAAVASGGGFSSFAFPGPQDQPESSISMGASTNLPGNQDVDDTMDTSLGQLEPPLGMTYNITESGATLRFDCVEGSDCGTVGALTSCAVPAQQQCFANIYWCSEVSQTFNFTVTGTAQKWPAGMDVLTIRHLPRVGQSRTLHYSASQGFPGCLNRYDWPFPCENTLTLDPIFFQPNPFFPGAIIQPGTDYFWPPYLIASRCAVNVRTDVRSFQPPYSSYSGVNRLSISFDSVDGCNKRGVWFQVDFQLLG